MKKRPTKKKKLKLKLGLPDWRDESLSLEERGLACYSDFEAVVDSFYSKDNLRLAWYSLYRGTQVYEPGGSRLAQGMTLHQRLAQASQEQVSTINIISTLSDSVQAEITKTKSRIKFETTGGDPMAQKKALNLSAYIDGVFADQEIYEKAPRSYKDAETDVYGCLKFWADEHEKKICLDYVSSHNIHVPNYQSIVNKPTEVFESRELTIEQLYALYPEAVGEWIDTQDQKKQDDLCGEVFLVAERWLVQHRDQVGCHMICWEHGGLFVEEWTFPFVPFAWCWWKRDTAGFHGTNIVEELVGIQTDMNRLLLRYMESIRQNAVTRWFIPQGSNINEDEIVDELNTFIRGSQAPTLMVPNAVLPAEVMIAFNTLKQAAYERIGMSALTAHGEKPGGLDSGVAQREYRETVSSRFALNEDLYASMFMQAAFIIIALTKELSKSSQDHQVRLIGRRVDCARIPWSEIDLDEDLYVMKPFNASFLPTTPAARVQFVKELIDMGMSKEDAMGLLEMPDSDAYIAYQTASLRAAQAVVDRMVKSRVMERFPPAVDPQIAYSYVNNRICIELQNPEPEQETLDLLDALRTTLLPKVNPPAQAPQPPAPPPQGMQQPPQQAVAPASPGMVS